MLFAAVVIGALRVHTKLNILGLYKTRVRAIEIKIHYITLRAMIDV